MLASPSVEGLIDYPVRFPLMDSYASASRDGHRLFFHLEHHGDHWTWELFDAHWADGAGPDDLLIGRWPD